MRFSDFLRDRVFPSVLSLLLVSIFSFSLIHLIPGDPVTSLLGMGYSEELAQEVRKDLFVEGSFLEQYFFWAKKFFSGDWGESLTTGISTHTLISEHFKLTLGLSLMSFIFALLASLPLSLWLARKDGGKLKEFFLSFGLVRISVPSFWLGMILIYIFSAKLSWLPSSGYYGLEYLIMPSLSLGLLVSGILLRQSVNTMDEIKRRAFVQSLRAKGLSETKIFQKHILKASALPILTISGIQLAYLLGGTIVIESLFRLPGLGSLTLLSIESRDVPVLQACILVGAAAFISLNVAVDLLSRVLDPRFRG